MESKKLITLEVNQEQILALQRFLFDDVTGDEREVLRSKVCTLSRSIDVAFENTAKYEALPNNLDQAHKLIEVQRNRIYELEKEELSFPFRMYLSLG
jgi:hypothetical protein